MPESDVIARAKQDKEEGKSPSTQAGEFVREEIDHVRHGVHGARSAKQAIAIGLSKARRAGVNLPPPKKDTSSDSVRRQAQRDLSRGRKNKSGRKTSGSRSAATTAALKRESSRSASHEALSKQARNTAKRRGSAARKRSARKAARTRSHSKS